MAASTGDATFFGRFREQLHTCGPQSWPSLFATAADIDAARKTVAAADLRRAAAALHTHTVSSFIPISSAESSSAADADAEAARRLLAAVCHPDTLQPIPIPLRMAAHVPVNTLLLIGMLGATSPWATGAWQFMNATFNAAQYYANRNATNHVPNGVLATSYASAMVTSVAAGVGLRAALNQAAAAAAHLPEHAPRRRLAYIGGASVAFLAAAAGKPFQIGCMRQDEWRQGVAVFDDDGLERGHSRLAGRAAVAMTVATRTVYLLPMLWLPLLRDAMFRALPRLAASPVGGGAAYTALVALHSAYATPLCMALFGQRTWMEADALEADFRGLTLLSSGGDVTRLWFNKGL